MKKIAVVLSGCGVYDGSEIHEAVFTMLAIDQCGAEAICLAPDMELAEVDHIAGKDMAPDAMSCLNQRASPAAISVTSKMPRRRSLMPGYSPAASGQPRTCATLP
jgi:enhancing lycopene biosynthesis protein 2